MFADNAAAGHMVNRRGKKFIVALGRLLNLEKKNKNVELFEGVNDKYQISFSFDFYVWCIGLVRISLTKVSF